MSKETKLIIGAAVIVILLIVGLAFLVTGKQSAQAAIPTNPVEGVEANPGNFDLGNVPYSGGLVTKEYEIKNTSGHDMKLMKIVTSCMCTVATVTINGKETIPYGMEMQVGNAILNLTFKNGETAKVTSKFDPTAHGPSGIGPINRSIYLYFDSGIKELTFAGNVVK